jgi:hypothetical protein
VNPEPDLSRQYRPQVSRVDADSNELAGIRLPDIAVPRPINARRASFFPKTRSASSKLPSHAIP